MKKQLISAAVSAVLVFSAPAFSTGIPVVDVTAIAKTVQEGLLRAQEAKAALDQAMREYEQAKNIGEDAKRRFEGYSDYSNLFDTASSYMKGNLSELAKPDNIGSLRQQYGLVSNEPAVQSKYDGMLQKISLYDNFNKQLTDNSRQLDSLQGRFSSATTPQQKQDIANQIQLEMVKQNSVMQQYEFAQAKIEKEEEIKQMQRTIERNKKHSFTGQ
ncbi:conjugal transfer protein TrbJ [Salmonella enterica]|jgi:type IV secretion system protein VirB5|nr:type IV secretion system protein [Aeromonas veronii]EAZ4194922.1 conjugal transfer protein TrbJ [Salmonella enterica]EES3185760.1 conjugal transfer protein TrbJ [Escherichia coli]EHW5331726.1 conjugal transfer protein TrbJ [Escherichia coli]